MSAITLKAHFDGNTVCLDEPFVFPQDAKVIVTVFTSGDEALEQERQAWLAASKVALARAYAEDEPDYSDCIGRFPPPT